MQNERILIIEDDKELSAIIEKFLKKEGYEVARAFRGDEGIQLAKEFQPVLIMLDLMLPGVDGFETCRAIRKDSLAPIIIISAKNSDMDKMLSLGIGADDYLEKPFSLLELQARVRSHIRRFTTFSAKKEPPKEIRRFGEVEIDPLSYRVTVCGKEIDLTAREFSLLSFLTERPSQVYSKEQLLDAVWGCAEFIDINTVTVYIGRIREKMQRAGACYIKTVWGAGYKWEM